MRFWILQERHTYHLRVCVRMMAPNRHIEFWKKQTIEIRWYKILRYAMHTQPDLIYCTLSIPLHGKVHKTLHWPVTLCHEDRYALDLNTWWCDRTMQRIVCKPSLRVETGRNKEKGKNSKVLLMNADQLEVAETKVVISYIVFGSWSLWRLSRATSRLQPPTATEWLSNNSQPLQHGDYIN